MWADHEGLHLHLLGVGLMTLGIIVIHLSLCIKLLNYTELAYKIADFHTFFHIVPLPLETGA